MSHITAKCQYKVILVFLLNSKSNLHYIRGITPKHETSDLAPGPHSSEETLQRWRAVGDIVSDLTGPGIEPQNLLSDGNVLPTELIGGVFFLITSIFILTQTKLEFFDNL